MRTLSQPAFDAAVGYIHTCLFGGLPGQEDPLLGKPAIGPRIRVVSIWVPGEGAMEPLKPEDRLLILATHPQAEPADLDEYERLLAARFTREPGDAMLIEPARAADDARLRELFQKLFG